MDGATTGTILYRFQGLLHQILLAVDDVES